MALEKSYVYSLQPNIALQEFNYPLEPFLKRRNFYEKMWSPQELGACSNLLIHLNAKYCKEDQAEWPNLQQLQKKIIIGGAGIGGLCCADELMKKGMRLLFLKILADMRGM